MLNKYPAQFKRSTMFFFTNKQLWLMIVFGFLLNGCGFHLQTKTEVPKEFRVMTFYSPDPHDFLAREVKNALIDNQIKLIQEEHDKSVPALRMMNYELNKDTVSIYQDGKAAEYRLILTVNAEVVVANQGIYPISVKIFRSFFDNPSAALAKDTEQTLITQEMYKQVADQLIRKLKTVIIKQNIHD